MYPKILSKEQNELLPLIKKFNKEYYLVGGTAIALQIGHRKSIDFDLFSQSIIKRKKIKRIIEETNLSIGKVIYETDEQFHIPVNSVKMTFFNYPYKIKHPVWFNKIITMPSLLDLASMKAYTLGRRAKWRDYVDLFFILKYHYPYKEIVENTLHVFGNFFNEKLFREQLSFFEDINFDQPVQFIGTPVKEDKIKRFLTQIATSMF